MRRVALALAMLALGCTNQNSVWLSLPEGGSLGFLCTDSATGRPLLERAEVAGGAVTASIAVDYLRVENAFLRCRPNGIYEYCLEEGCPFITRDCRDIRLTGPIPDDLQAAQALVFEELQREDPLNRDAPDGPLMIRLFGSTQTCAELGNARPRCDGLLGCVYSCVVNLDEDSGPIDLDLDALGGDGCNEQIVGICAGLGFGLGQANNRCQP